MSKPTYNFTPGDKLYAKDVNSIDPDNPTEQTPAKLIGGDDVVLANFQALGVGDNDGAFKINIDGVEYDNVSIDLWEIVSSTGISISQEIGNYGAATYGALRQGQSFFWEGGILTKIDLTLRKVGTPTGEYTLNLYEADENDFPTGSVIKSVSKLAQDLTTSYADYSFDFNVSLVSNKNMFSFKLYRRSSSDLFNGLILIVMFTAEEEQLSYDGGSTWTATILIKGL